jgi:uncharacterized repeat protein (TIGR03803 family)
MKRVVDAWSKLNWGKRAYAIFVLCAMTTTAVPGQTLTMLHSFDGTDGEDASTLVQGSDGNLYGTTYKGGANGYGTIFKITRSGTLTTLYNFCSQSGCTDGKNPNAALVQAPNGDFYGTASAGGANGHGTIFKITPSGTLTTTHSFDLTDGGSPYSALTRATNGDFYGTTWAGGASGGGTVFKVTPGGTLTTVYSLCGDFCPGGGNPNAGLVQTPNGDFYGTTYGGGDIICYMGCGTIFSITPSGTLTTLYSFCSADINCPDGENPVAGLVEASNGDFYGASYWGGSNQYGTLFEMTPGGSFTTLHTFCSQGCSDGYHPSGVIQATDGNLYGTTQFAGTTNGGAIFKMTTSGALTTLYGFCAQSGCPDGENPFVALVQDTDGNFYGTTSAGGANGYGTVFSLSVGLRPFVKTLPHAGKVGASIILLGTNLTGATSVSFSGAAAAFTVVSATEITATVPAGATTGRVHVTTPAGTLLSDGPFLVLP